MHLRGREKKIGRDDEKRKQWMQGEGGKVRREARPAKIDDDEKKTKPNRGV